MTDFLSRIENFLFDVLGLILPGLVFLSILIFPALFLNHRSPSNTVISPSVISSLSNIANRIKYELIDDQLAVVVVLLITCYLVGHLIKVFSIIMYEFLAAIFDESLNKLAIYLFLGCLKQVNYYYNKLTKRKLYGAGWYKQVRLLYLPFKNSLRKVFVFKPLDYFDDNQGLLERSVDLINERLDTTYPRKWYSIYKYSTIISWQNNVKSLAGNFLAKYNLYRSLSFLFMFSTIYYWCIIEYDIEVFSHQFVVSKDLLVLSSIFLWFTFHYKYKRYWTLCGNETLMSLFYFLNKARISDEAR
jgi:hypothetical protein